MDTRPLRKGNNTAASDLAERFFGKDNFFFVQIKADNRVMKVKEIRTIPRILLPGKVCMELELIE